ncbi:MAG: glycosyltransferase [Bacteroidaceae bacterium]|nr:glycosyltransferase [Bacteroidaceae bacterium]
MFSIIIPLYNKSTTIQKSISSVLLQKNADFEVVVIDDGSTDDSREKVHQMKDDRIKYFYKQNGGVSSARNEGIKKSIGDWLLFLDADDELLPGALEVWNHLKEKYTQCKFFVGNFEWAQENVPSKMKLYDQQTHCPFLGMWLRKFYPSPRNMLIHRSLITQYGDFDERMSFFEDWDFSLRMARCGVIGYTNAYIARYNQGREGLSQTAHAMEKEMAYYIPEMMDNKISFWNKALLYENIEFEIGWWKHDQKASAYYKEMLNSCFPPIYQVLHRFRQKFIQYHFI